MCVCVCVYVNKKLINACGRHHYHDYKICEENIIILFELFQVITFEYIIKRNTYSGGSST